MDSKPICYDCAYRWIGHIVTCSRCRRTCNENYCLAGLDDDGKLPGGPLRLLERDPITGQICGPEERTCVRRNGRGQCKDFRDFRAKE